MPYVNETAQVKKTYEDEILKLKNVTGVGVGKSIIIYVEKYTRQLTEALPTNLEGIPVRIIQTGKIVPLSLMKVPPAHALYADRTIRYRPTVPAGVSIGHPDVTAGTLGARAIDKNTGKTMGLSNNHVCALQWGEEHVGKVGDPILQPGSYDGGTLADKVGELDRWVEVFLEGENLIDAAVFSSNMLAPEILELGQPDQLVEAFPGMHLVKSGRTSGVNYGQVLGISETIIVEGWGSVVFKDQITIQPAMLSPGDSGSCILEQDSLRVIGLGHSGSSEISVACKSQHIAELLNIQIVSPVEYLPWYTVIGVLAGMVSLGKVTVGALWPAGKIGITV